MTNPEIICAGMVVADVLVEGFTGMPAKGHTGSVERVSMATGGDAMNQSAALRKLGHEVELMGLVGDDAQGRFVAERCRAAGIGTRALVAGQGVATSTAIVLIGETGEQSFLAPRISTLSVMSVEHMDLSLIRPGLKVLSVASLFWAPKFDRTAVAPLLKRAKEVGAVTVADMVTDQLDYGLDGLAEAWPYLDYAVPSQLEGETFTGTSDPAGIAAAFRARGVRDVIVKRGSEGVAGFVGDKVIRCPAFRVKVADTTGAGDNFVAGFVHGLVTGLDTAAALRFGSATAALSIQEVGAGAGLKNLAQVEAFLAAAGA